MANFLPSPVLALALTLAPPTPTPSPAAPALWFRLGHRVVAELAGERLSPGTAAAVRELLGGQALADASTWADEIRDGRGGSGRLHFVNIPITAAAYDPSRDCPGGRCIIAAIDSFAGVLADAEVP